jgi:ribosomal protein S18 acetylase RimI-like enzyme
MRLRSAKAVPAAPGITLRTAQSDEDIALARSLMNEYALALNIDLRFQDFDRELANLPGEYAEPCGVLLLVTVGNAAAGCCALRRLDSTDYPNASEMKRLYVRPAFRGLGVGRQLAQAILDAARRAGYSAVLLDTLSDMEAARMLYEELGFSEVAPYYHNPIAGAHYLKVDL